MSAEVGLLCRQVFLDVGKTNIVDLLAIIFHSTSCGSCTECSKLQLVTDTPPTNTFQFPSGKSGLFLQRLLPTSIGFPE